MSEHDNIETTETAAASLVDDYTQGLRVERALAHLQAISDPIARVRAADDLADQARGVQSDISQIRRRAIYEATLRPGHTGESVAAQLQVSAKAVSSAVSEFRAKDRRLFQAALEILTRDGVTETPVDQLTPGLRARDVLVQARLVLLAYAQYHPDKTDVDDFELLESAAKRAQEIHRSVGAEAPARAVWDRLTFTERSLDWEQVPPGMLDAARVFNVLPGIVPLFFDLPDITSAERTSIWWRIAWGILPAEDGATVFDAGPHRDGWATTEYLVWFVRDMQRAGYSIWTEVYSPPPYLNQPGESLTFTVEGDLRGEKPIHPDQFVRDLKTAWADQSTGFMEIDWPTLELIGHE
jgi:hypothetical protein